MITLEGPRGLAIMGRASLVEEDRELAWAERFVRPAPDLAWVLGNFVCADTPNYNGHIFPLEDLKASYPAIANRPLNLVHNHHQIVGVFAGAELVYPTTMSATAPPAEAASAPQVPYVEAVAAFYKFYFPDTFNVVKDAHAQGNLFFSMEAVPKTLTCAGNGDGSTGCGREFAYKGRLDESYCDHLREPGAHRVMNKPRFTAGALVLPPSRPGWKDADITELSRLMDHHLYGDELEMALEQGATEFSNLSAQQWEEAMASLVSLAFPSSDREFKMAERKKMANKGSALGDGSFPISDHRRPDERHRGLWPGQGQAEGEGAHRQTCQGSEGDPPSPEGVGVIGGRRPSHSPHPPTAHLPRHVRLDGQRGDADASSAGRVRRDV